MVCSFDRQGEEINGTPIGDVRRILLMVRMRVPRSQTLVRFAQRLTKSLEGDRVFYPGPVKKDMTCVVWRKFVAALWHETGSEVLMTCDVPISVFTCQVAAMCVRHMPKRSRAR